MKSWPPLKKSVTGRLRRPGIGFSILAGLIPVGVIIATVVVRLDLSNTFAISQAPTAPSGLADKTSPELLMARREKDQARLNTYGWVDKEAGLVRIPINQAMALIAERGLPVGSADPEQTTPEDELPTTTPAPEVNGEVPEAETAIVEEPATALSGPDSPAEPAAGEEPPPEPSPTLPPAPPVNLAEISFKEHVLPILEQHCVECHGGEKPGGGQKIEEGLILTTYDDILYGSFNGTVIEPGNAADSYLIEQIATGRMPKEGPRLSPAEVEIITAWVEAGAPDN